MEISLPAIRVRQPIGEFFLCSIPAEVLLKVAYSIPATARENSNGVFSFFGIQRRLDEKRLRAIGEYIDNDESTFPNSIILSANYSDDGHYEEDEELRWGIIESTAGALTLRIPSEKRLASIIDGQHRLEAFRHVHKEDRLSMELPCAIFINLPRAYQADIFATINFNQKRVDKGLAYQLFGYDLEGEDRSKWPPDMLALYFARIFSNEKGGPFEHHIKLAVIDVDSGDQSDRNHHQEWKVSIAAIVEGISKLISSKPTSDRNALLQGLAQHRSDLGKEDKDAPLRDMYIAGADLAMYEIIKGYFLAVEKSLWSRQRTGFINRTVGILALFDVLRKALIVNPELRGAPFEAATKILEPARSIDFSDNYFHASGAGRVRIRKILEYSMGLLPEDKFDPEFVMSAKKLLHR